MELFGEIIVGGMSLAGVIITCITTSRKASRESDQRLERSQIEADHRLEKAQMEARAEQEKAQAVTNAKIEELTREVREHNNFARRMPVVEEQIRVINHRLQDLEDI